MGEMWHDKGPDPLNILLLPSPDKPHTPKGLFLPPLGRPAFTTDPWLAVPTNAENGRVPIDWNRLGNIQDFHCLRTLGIQLDTGEPLDELVAILEQMDGLKKLAIMHVGRQSEKAWLEGFGRFETCEHIARRCKGLTYLQLGGISMRIWRSAAGEVDLEELSEKNKSLESSSGKKILIR
ncbi:hypothetical protein CSOJ01_12303 [Colletotrichum sojae]|uniref:Uncharacterized protein n=1 Tax=Colletotrichum sojae TaxID=2175907 RepID=A0A8H6MM00_9PEZI|nr:hypothetical protein CSOJ01_12303 [Colletotrichum sojae]